MLSMQTYLAYNYHILTYKYVPYANISVSPQLVYNFCL